MINHGILGNPDFQTNPNLANGASASGFTLPPLHPLHPFARWARRARRRSPAAAAKLRLLHPIHREAFFCRRLDEILALKAINMFPFWKLLQLLPYCTSLSWAGSDILRVPPWSEELHGWGSGRMATVSLCLPFAKWFIWSFSADDPVVWSRHVPDDG